MTIWNWTTNCQDVFDVLKGTFVTVLVLAHWDPEAPITVETNTLDYALATILSIYVKRDIYPVAFYSRTFNQAELNYDIHDKKLLTIYKAFRKWHHYLEGTLGPIDVVINHKNLTYFSGSKLLTRRQVYWSKYLAQFNLLIQFRPGRLGKKPDTLMQRPDLYPTKETQSPESANLYNYRPLFIWEQLAFTTRMAYLDSSPSSSKKPLDIESLHIDIRRSLL